MSRMENRPRFKQHVPWSVEEVITRVKTAIAEQGAPVTGQFSGHHIYLKIPREDHHAWTPQLDIELEHLPEGGTLIKGLVGPTPAVWTKFIFLYAFLGFGVLVGFITGLPQWMLGKTPVGFGVMILSAVLVTLVYFVAQTGKRIASPQTEILRGFWGKSWVNTPKSPCPNIPLLTSPHRHN